MELSRKKIAVVCNYELLPDRIGGMDHFFWAFDAACKQEGMTVDWFFPNTMSHPKYDQLHIITPVDTDVTSFFSTYIQQHAYDVVCTHFVELCTSFFKWVKTVLPACNVIAVDHNPRPINGYPLKKQLKKRLKGMTYGKYIDQFIGVSEYTKRELIKDFGKGISSKVEVIYNGIVMPKALEKPKPKSNEQLRFVVVSHLRASKGIQDLIQAVHQLPSGVKEQFHATVYGDGPYKEELLKLIFSLGLASQFDFKGSVANVGGLLQDYDYLIHPTHMECFSLTLLESLAMNLPVITTNVGGNTEVIKNAENGFIFNAGDVNALQAILTQVLCNTLHVKEKDYSNLIKKQYTLEMMVANYMKLLR
ncbi:glycosyltransferase family 4 protein [Zhouia sp. PK063]|uniref:glycosyltransferase family 4 protein n=1 Tax=Zhouia sp. PK063 TaxID=3373602 RepID=UPI0037969199